MDHSEDDPPVAAEPEAAGFAEEEVESEESYEPTFDDLMNGRK